MAIVSTAQLLKTFSTDRVKELAMEDSGGVLTYDVTIVNDAITLAEGTIYNALDKLYSTAEINADAGVRRIASVIAYYYLESRRSAAPEYVITMYELALRNLEQLKKGEIVLAAVGQVLPSGETELENFLTKSGYFDGIYDTFDEQDNR